MPTGRGFRHRWAIAALALAALLPDAVRADVLYPPARQADADLRAALTRAATTQRHVLLEIGANWCLDCQRLAAVMQQPRVASILDAHYVVVRINVGRFTDNLSLARRYRVHPRQGIPALAVLAADGHLLYAPTHGGFESMPALQVGSLRRFLEHWITTPE